MEETRKQISADASAPRLRTVDIVKKSRPSYQPRRGKKMHGMRAKGPLMGCPGKSSCIYGERCPVPSYGDPPARWTACAIEAKRYGELWDSLRPWIEEARRRPQIVDPAWIEELAAAYVEIRLRVERLQRYTAGKGLIEGLPGFNEDSVVARHQVCDQTKCEQLRLYLLDLIAALREGQSRNRATPAPRSRRRTAWFDEKPRARQGKKGTGKRKRGKPKLYQSHRVKTIIKRFRQRNAS